jgi:hypothetical protein
MYMSRVNTAQERHRLWNRGSRGMRRSRQKVNALVASLRVACSPTTASIRAILLMVSARL